MVTVIKSVFPKGNYRFLYLKEENFYIRVNGRNGLLFLRVEGALVTDYNFIFIWF